MRRTVSLIIFLGLLTSSWCYSNTPTNDDTLQANISSRFLLFPIVMRTPETDWGFGLASAIFFKANHVDDNLRTSDVNLVSLYTLRKQVVIVLGSTIFFKNENQIFRFQGSVSYYPDKTWGIGNNSPAEAKENYEYKQYFLNPQILQKVFRGLYLGAGMEVQNLSSFRYMSGGVFDTQEINGRHGGYTSGFGVSIAWDKRNNAYSPSHGFFGEFNYSTFDPVLASDFKFNVLKLDLRKFFLYRVNDVIAFQILLRRSRGEVPIRYLSLLGGSEMMRGYYLGRYADKSMMIYQAEWRHYIFWRLGFVLFASMGEVGPEFSAMSFPQMHYAGGGGLRIMVKEKEKLNLRMDYGIAKHSHGIYVTLKEAF